MIRALAYITFTAFMYVVLAVMAVFLYALSAAQRVYMLLPIRRQRTRVNDAHTKRRDDVANMSVPALLATANNGFRREDRSAAEETARTVDEGATE